MRTSDKGIALIKKYEGFRSYPYLCPAGVPTIGYGATYYPDKTPVSMNDEPITEIRAQSLLRIMLKRYEQAVSRYVQVPINQNQFDALVSFAYNCGNGALQRSTLLKKVNLSASPRAIETQFLRWCRANGRVLNGLLKRRREESALFNS